MKKIRFVSIALAAAAALGCRNKEMAALNQLEKDRFMVKVERPAVRTLDEEILLTGSAKALDEAVLFPRVSGKLLKNVLIEGDPVKKDETVAVIERDEPGVVFEPAPVPSTLTGVVGRIYQDVGTNVTPQTPIALVVNQRQVRVKVDLPERYLGSVRIGQNATVSVEAFPDKFFSGKVYRISPVIDMASRSVPIEVLVDNADNRLKSGMFTQVKLIVGHSDASLTVPASCIQQDSAGSYVFVNAGGFAARRDVVTGIKTVEYTQIKSGLRDKDSVIIFGLYGLKDASKLEIVKN